MEIKQVSFSEADIIASGIPKTWACVDCGINIAPGCMNASQVAAAFRAKVLNPGGASLTVSEASEVYIVKSAVWTAAGEPGGCLCVACLEKRIGRLLTPKDFPRKNALNWLPCTARLLARRDAATDERDEVAA